MKSLILYSTIVGGFYAQTDPLEKAIATARNRVGGDTWKRGYSASAADGATVAAKTELSQAGIEPVQFEGILTHVGFVENKDNAGNVYPKLRVSVKHNEDELMMSLDLKSDVAQRMMVKLDNCKPGDHVRVSAWPTIVERAGRQFVNHAVSMKNDQGAEVPANAWFSAEVKTQTDSVEHTLRAAGIDDKKVIATAKATKRIAANKELLLKIESRFAQAKTAE
jgi:hypothetical protein